MQFDTNNKIVSLCAEGMDLEGRGKPEEANRLFIQAWKAASNDFEKFTAAHYIARHQKNVDQKLEWDKAALEFALNISENAVKGTLPSLYLNIAKCYEDKNDFANARKNYELAHSFIVFLPDNEYGNMIKRGISNGIERVNEYR